MEARALALNTATLGHNLPGQGRGWPTEKVMDACAARGLGGVVLWRREVADPQRLRALSELLALPIIGLCRTPYLVGPEADPDDLKASLAMAAALGAPVLTIVVGGIEPGSKGVGPTLDVLKIRLETALKDAEAAGVTLALEPLHPMMTERSALVRARDAVDILTMFDHDRLQLAVDVYHVWWDLGLAAALADVKGRIAGFHLCDWKRDTDHLFLDRGMMGDGVADLPGLAALVRSAGFTGVAEVEIFSRNDWWRRDPAEVLDTMIARAAAL